MLTDAEVEAISERWRTAYSTRLQDLGPLEAALAELRKAVQTNPGDASLQFMLGCTLEAVGLPEEALAPLREVLKVDPEGAAVHYYLGLSYQGMDRYDEAHGHFKEALRLRLRDEAQPGAPKRPGPRVPVARTTLVCVDCRNHELAIATLRRSMAQCRFEKVKFFTNRTFDLPDIEVVQIPDIASIADYSRFMVKELGHHVDTDFALVVQYDGYILNGRRWSDDFLKYDYIGAPWNSGNVGNGGFSLRSRRLMTALRDKRVVHLVPEDAAICQTYRPALEKEYNIRFAPAEVASRFSFETLPPPVPTLGFHGITHMIHIVDMTEEELAEYHPSPMLNYVKT
jgi:tetratricopeptide (TPR) repeat protein